MRSVCGAKENRTRPAINPLFRSAAANYGPRVTGVILTGLLDDGTAGLAEIKRKGGVAIVQEPSSAMFREMPDNAVRFVATDYIVALDEIAGLIAKLSITERDGEVKPEPMERTLLEAKCPECDGPLWEERQGAIVEYRCLVGHAYSPLALRAETQDSLERSLWAAAISLEETAQMYERLGGSLGPEALVAAREKRAEARVIREMLEKLKPPMV